MSAVRRPTRVLLVAMAAAVALTATGCVPEPATSPSAGPSASVSASPTPTPSPTPTEEPPAALPALCTDIYSAAMLAQLEGGVPPLNDPGIEMLSSQNAVALDLLASGIPTLRCTWGPPSEYGIATNVSQLDATQAAGLREELLQAGFSEEAFAGGAIFRIQQDVLTMDDQVVTLGEVHFIGEGGWVSTRWIDADIPGYTEDIAATVWG